MGLISRLREQAADSKLGMKAAKAREVWKNSAAEDSGRVKLERSRHELEFLPAALEIIETPPSPTARLTTWILLGIFCFALLWAIVGRTDVVVVTQGIIQPLGRTLVIQPLEIARIQKIHVKDGQEVRKGDVLVELDPTESDAEKEKVQDQLIQSMLDVARLRSLIENPTDPESTFTPPTVASAGLIETQRSLMRAQYIEQKAKLSSIDATVRNNEAQRQTIQTEVDKLMRTLPLIRQRAEAQMGLAERGLAPRNQALQLEEQLVTAQQDLQASRSRLNEIDATINSATEQRAQVISEFKRARLGELAEAQQRVVALRQEMIKADDRVNRRTITAPEDGYVQNLKINTTGGVVQEAEEIMRIVPKGTELEVEAQLQNKDRGLVNEGMPVQVKIDAFSFNKYGLLNGTVRSVSNDSIQIEKVGPVFMMRVALESDTLDKGAEPVTIKPGMSVIAEVKVDRRRVINFVLSPIIKGLDEAAREK